jgi:hypothetical protein
MRGCGVFTGILFSRKLCPQLGVTTCGRCKTPLCKLHVRPQRTGPFLCPSCDAYQNDDSWRYSDRDNSWHYRDRTRADERVPAAAAGAAAAGDLAEEDKAGLSTNAAGAWNGPDDTSPDAGGASADDTDSDGDFDAS